MVKAFFFFLVRAHALLIMCAHLVKRVHEILKYTHCPQFHETRRTGRSNFDKTACSYIYLLVFHIVMDRDSIKFTELFKNYVLFQFGDALWRHTFIPR